MLVWARLWFGGCGSGFGVWAFLLPLPILVVPSAYLVLHSFELLSKFFSLSLLVCCGGMLKWMNAHWAFHETADIGTEPVRLRTVGHAA